MHRHSGHWKLGLLLAVCADLMWGIQPIALSHLVRTLSPNTIAFSKLLSAAIALAIYMPMGGKMPAYLSHGKRMSSLLLSGALGMGLSYVCFAGAFKYISPANAQVYIQLSRLFLALGGIYFFKETFSRSQWAGLVTLAVGFIVFYRDQSAVSEVTSTYVIGVAFVIASAVTWAVYALCQKELLTTFSSKQILLFFYVASAFGLAGFAQIPELFTISSHELTLLLIVCASNLLAFVFFAEAMNHWDVTRVSALSCLTPFFTLGALAILRSTTDLDLPVEVMSPSSYLGAILVVSGSVVVTFASRQKAR